MSLGTVGAKALLVASLEAAVALKVVEKRTALSMTAQQLPAIKSTRPVTIGKAALGEYPVLYVVSQDTATKGSQQVRGGALGGVQYQFVYRFVVVLLVRSTSYPAVTRMQEALALCVRESLLQAQQLIPVDDTPDSLRIERDSIRERFSGIEQYGRDQAFYGGCMTDVNLLAHEFVPHLTPARGTADTFVVHVSQR